MNLTLAIAVYANICKALGLPLGFPGKPGAYTALYVRTQHSWQRPSSGWRPTRNAPTRRLSPTVILSGGKIYSPSSPISSRWSWPPTAHQTLGGRWPTRGRSGKKLSKRNGLQKFRFEEHRLRYEQGPPFRFFHDLVDTEEMFFRTFSDFRRERIIP
jgi:hypothetical protein